jgi:hypothetical protein
MLTPSACFGLVMELILQWHKANLISLIVPVTFAVGISFDFFKHMRKWTGNRLHRGWSLGPSTHFMDEIWDSDVAGSDYG